MRCTDPYLVLALYSRPVPRISTLRVTLVSVVLMKSVFVRATFLEVRGGKEHSRHAQEPVGRNEKFREIQNGESLSRAELVREIRAGNRPGYHVRVINGVATPVSNPDRSEGNNLGSCPS